MPAFTVEQLIDGGIDGGKWRVRWTIEHDAQGFGAVAGFTVEPVGAVPPRGLPLELVKRELKLKRMMRAMRDNRWANENPDGVQVRSARGRYEEIRRRDVQRAAQIYRVAVRAGTSPRRAIMDRLGVSSRRARYLVRLARQRELLAPYTPALHRVLSDLANAPQRRQADSAADAARAS
jgi:hypothetical protein